MLVDKQLYYETITTGKGSEIVQETSKPLVYYSVHTLDGTEVTNTFDYAKPIAIPLNDAIPGFVKGVIGMKQGERRTLYVHPDLAYHRGGNVPPNSLLIFDVEVVEINRS
jgi:peptidylprolyl isomerase